MTYALLISTPQTWLSLHQPPHRPFRLRPSMIMMLHRLGTEDAQPDAHPGTYRDIAVHVKGTGPDGGTFHPPAYKDVPGLVEEMCDSLNEGWRTGGQRAAPSLTAQVGLTATKPNVFTCQMLTAS